MERKTQIDAEAGKQELTITREFDLPVELLFRAHVEAEIVEQWMGTKVVKLESKKHGGFEFETADSKGNKYRFSGVFHEFVPNEKITRTFEFENTPYGVQLEFLEFERLTDDTSKLKVHTVYRSAARRDQMLQCGMSQGMNMAHNRLQEAAGKLKEK
jgi:uncharacterized protein YndB with AHSA1/START domain